MKGFLGGSGGSMISLSMIIHEIRVSSKTANFRSQSTYFGSTWATSRALVGVFWVRLPQHIFLYFCEESCRVHVGIFDYMFGPLFEHISFWGSKHGPGSATISLVVSSLSHLGRARRTLLAASTGNGAC